MAVIIKETSRRSYLFRRVFRRVRAVLGGLLVTAASTTGMLVLLIPAIVLAGLASGGNGSPLTSHDKMILGEMGRAGLLAALITGTGWATGVYLLRGRRGMVLWLRRFRYGDATRVVSTALDYVGRSWRVVTLDDAATEPVGVASALRVTNRLVTFVGAVGPRLARRLGVVGKVAAWASGAGIVAVVVWTVYHGGLPAFWALANALVAGGFGPPETAEAALVWVFAAVLVGEFALMLVLVLIRLAMVPIFGFFVLASDVTKGLTQADAAKSGTVRDLADVDAAVASVASASRKVLAPRLTVLNVDGSVWRETVTAIARQSDAVLIDVSQVTDNLMWEVEEMTRLIGTRIVFVGRHDRLLRLTRTMPLDEADPVMADGFERLGVLLDGREVLAYTPSLFGRLRFQRALFGELEGTRPPATLDRRDTVRGLFVLAGIVCFALGVRAAVTLVANWL